MKFLILMRHADAIALKPCYSADFSIIDFDRKLSERGIKEAFKAKSFISSYLIDEILVSSAKRTLETAEIIFGKKKNFTSFKELYNASSEKLIEIIHAQDSSVNKLMVIGHNPTISEVALNLTSENIFDKEARFSFLSSGFPTAGIIVITFNILDWKMISNINGEILNTFIPILE